MSKIQFSIITLFPEMFQAIQKEGVIARAIAAKLIEIQLVYLRDFANNPRKQVDDHPFGGGDGMVIKADITENAIESVRQKDSCIIHLTPAGKVFNNGMAKKLAQEKHLILLCGRYAGFDCRVVKRCAHLNISMGDFILSGGELPAMCVIDTVARFLPGVLGNQLSAYEDSFEQGLLEAPQYTKPVAFHEDVVPSVLLSGDHKKIEEHKKKERIRVTAKERADLILQVWDKLSSQERMWCEKIWKHDIQ